MNQKDRMRLVIETDISLQTVTNWDLGRTVLPATENSLRKAAKALGIEAPPKKRDSLSCAKWSRGDS